ncbi:hypothetical protein B0T17DRAFT_543482 [Bombardia bombarda]|uniref:Uncharacterized protein n=1 Tax=Bombardia bombarda TaxID=252184 RepID=A0AA39U705_9PEZI|nr:hypothetical protein B0T17DRAFT_543482 [Bombardia bombarda]
MSVKYYNVDDVIHHEFFRGKTATREECDDLAVSLLDCPISPVPIQGGFSYTITGLSTEWIVQFRKETATLSRPHHGGRTADRVP